MAVAYACMCVLRVRLLRVRVLCVCSHCLCVLCFRFHSRVGSCRALLPSSRAAARRRLHSSRTASGLALLRTTALFKASSRRRLHLFEALRQVSPSARSGVCALPVRRRDIWVRDGCASSRRCVALTVVRFRVFVSRRVCVCLL
jgi:hypothetical protein